MKDLQAVFDLASGREVNEPIIACVKAADETGDTAGRSPQAEIDTAIYFHVEIGIADDELKRSVVRSAGEKFLHRRRALRIIEIERELPILGEIVNRTGRTADRPELLVLLTGRRQRSQLGVA